MCMLLVCGSISYRRNYDTIARYTAIFGMGILAVLLGSQAAQFLLGYKTDTVIVVSATIAGTLVVLHGTVLIHSRWERANQLTYIVTVLALILSPFYAFESMALLIREFFALQLTIALDIFNHSAVLEERDGGLVQLNFDSGGRLTVLRACTGIDGLAVFLALVIGVRATWQTKLKSIVVVISVVYFVNMGRLMLVGGAVSGDWFGPLVTNQNTLYYSYHIAENVIGTGIVVIASIGGYLVLANWLPDLDQFVREFFHSFKRYIPNSL